MTTAEVLQLVGLMVTVAALMATLWWRLSAKISANCGKLHSRIDDMREHYVRRDDLMQHIDRIENGQTQHINRMENGQNRIIEAVAQLGRRIDGLVDRNITPGD